MTADLISDRALNRATLDRQLLLRRSGRSTLDAVAHLVGLQAQIPLNPYLALWSRLASFRPERLGRMVEERAVVRIVVMRGTLHLVTVDDALVLRPLAQPVLDGELARHPEHGAPLRDADLAPVLAYARSLVEERPRTQTELRAALAARFPDGDAPALAYACRNHLAFVQVPPRGVWGRAGQVTSTTLESWTGRPLAVDPSVDDVVLRYLGAFGPATAADVGAWSRLAGMREVVERLSPRLRTWRDDRGRELVDLPGAPHPDADTPAPPRFLPEYDNVLLSYADRSRFLTEEGRSSAGPGTRTVKGTVLVDGFLRATWRIEPLEPGRPPVLVVDHVGRFAKRIQTSVAAEGRRVLRFLATGSGDAGAAARAAAEHGDIHFSAIG